MNIFESGVPIKQIAYSPNCQGKSSLDKDMFALLEVRWVYDQAIGQCEGVARSADYTKALRDVHQIRERQDSILIARTCLLHRLEVGEPSDFRMLVSRMLHLAGHCTVSGVRYIALKAVVEHLVLIVDQPVRSD